MKTPDWNPRRLLAIDERRIEELADVLIDCVDGGASVSFMHPLSRERATDFWRAVATGVAAGERVVLIAEDAGGVCGTVQLVLKQPDNQPHRADLGKMLVHRRAPAKGWGPLSCGPLRRPHANAAKRSWCWTPSPTVTPRGSTNAWAGSGSAISPAMPCYRGAGSAAQPCTIGTSGNRRSFGE